MPPAEVQEHETRKAVYGYIAGHPGVTPSVIQSALALAESTLRYHLRYLERHGMVFSRERGNFRCYFPAGRTAEDLVAFPEVDPSALTDVQKQITDLVRQRPGITMTDMESLTGINRRVLQYNVKVLREQMLLWKMGNGRSTCYEIASKQKLRSEMLKFLIIKFLRGDIDERTYLSLKGEVEREGMDG